MDDNLSTVNAGQEVNVEPQINEVIEQVNNNEPVNAGVEEVAQSSTNKPVQSAEENARYAAIRREAEAKAEAKARDALISEMYGESHGIHTYADYQRAVEEQRERERAQALEESIKAKYTEVPDELLQEVIENQKFREKYLAKEKQEQLERQQQAEFNDFMTAFPDVKPNEIPTEVWQLKQKGVPLKYAYMEYAYKQNQATQIKNTANFSNANTSMGSVNSNGPATDADFISADTYETNKGNQDWVNKNFTKIMKSRSKW